MTYLYTVINKFVFLTGIISFCCQTSFAQNSNCLPASSVGKIAALFFEAYNSDDDNKMKDFIAEYRTPNALSRISVNDRMKQHQFMKKRIPSLECRLTGDTETDSELVVYAVSKEKESWYRLSFELDAEASGLLENFSLKHKRPPKEKRDRNKNLKASLKRIIQEEGIPGIAMGEIKNGNISQIAVEGKRKIDGKEFVAQDDKFHIGSVAKTMTASLIGRLIENGELSLGTTLKEIFPEMQLAAGYSSVTIEHLLNHTAGLPQFVEDNEEEKKLENELLYLTLSPQEQRLEFTKRILIKSPPSKVGTFNYSNAGYAILGAVLEKVSGESWESLVHKFIFEPLSMSNSGIGWPQAIENEDQPYGHSGNLGELKIQNQDDCLLPSYLSPAGNVHCSVADLAKFVIAHIEGLKGKDTCLLKSETIKLLHANNSNQYTSGWLISDEENQTIHKVIGSAGTFMAYAKIETETGNGWVFLSNAGDPKIIEVFEELIEK